MLLPEDIKSEIRAIFSTRGGVLSDDDIKEIAQSLTTLTLHLGGNAVTR